MQSSKYSKVLTITLIVVVIIIIGLLIFWGVSVLNKQSVNSDADEGISAFRNQINSNLNNNTNNTVNNSTNGNSVSLVNPYGNSIVPAENLITDGNISNGEIATEYKGFPMLGYIEIPKTGIKYPILAEANMSALETSVAVLHGVGLNKVGNTVIVGHNYRNGTFFSDNAKLAIGDKIYITDGTGQTLTYTIYKKYQTTPEDADYATRDTQGAKEITLSTCTDDSAARIIVWAKAD